MYRDTAEFKNQRTVGLALLCQLIGQVAVFDNGYLAVDQTEIADPFLRPCLYQHLRRHLRPVQNVQTDKERVENIEQRIINLEIA